MDFLRKKTEEARKAFIGREKKWVPHSKPSLIKPAICGQRSGRRTPRATRSLYHDSVGIPEDTGPAGNPRQRPIIFAGAGRY